MLIDNMLIIVGVFEVLCDIGILLFVEVCVRMGSDFVVFIIGFVMYIEMFIMSVFYVVSMFIRNLFVS